MRWICLIISPSHCRKGPEVIERELRKIFGDDLEDFRMAPEDNWDEGCYCFVKSSEYEAHIQNLRTSMAVTTVLPSYEKPNFLLDLEVDSFAESVDKPRNFRKGDIVKVREGYLSDLIGIVVRLVDDTTCRVLFKFHTRSFEEFMDVSGLGFVDNLFRLNKFPVTSDKAEAYAKDPGIDEVCWSTDRTSDSFEFPSGFQGIAQVHS